MTMYEFDSHHSTCLKPCTTLKIRSISNGRIIFGNSQIRLHFDPEVISFKSIKKISVFDIFNVVGNAGGLWLGVSLLSLFDFVKKSRNKGGRVAGIIVELMLGVFFIFFCIFFLNGIINNLP